MNLKELETRVIPMIFQQWKNYANDPRVTFQQACVLAEEILRVRDEHARLGGVAGKMVRDGA